MSSNPFGAPVEHALPTGEMEEVSMETFDFSEVSDGYTIEAGVYPAKCIDCVRAVSKSGNKMLTLTYALTGGEYVGREFKSWCVTSGKGAYQLRNTLIAMGLMSDDPSVKSAQITPDAMIGKAVMLEIVDDSYQGKPTSSVKGALPHPDGADIYNASLASL